MGQDPDFISTLTLWAKSWQTFYCAKKHAAAQVASRQFMVILNMWDVDFEKENAISTVRRYRVRPKEQPLFTLEGVRWREYIWDRHPSSPKAYNLMLAGEKERAVGLQDCIWPKCLQNSRSDEKLIQWRKMSEIQTNIFAYCISAVYTVV